MSGDEDKAQGKWDETKGKAKQAWGSATDDKSTEASGKADEAKGKGRQAWGDAKDWVDDKTDNDDEK
jgi:uncharacterized protein YjbJ (UPF0337 family)